MLVGRVDVFTNHGVLIVSTTPTVDADLSLEGEAAVASGTHALVATRGQKGLTRVRLWSGTAMSANSEVINANFVFPGPHLHVFDIENLSVHTFAVAKPGGNQLSIAVDDPGNASRIDIYIGPEGSERGLSSVGASTIPPALVQPGEELAAADELALILSDQDIPAQRLAAAIKLLSSAPSPRPAVFDSRVSQVVEWIRWLGPRQSFNRSVELGRTIKSAIESNSRSDDSSIRSLADQIIAQTYSEL